MDRRWYKALCEPRIVSGPLFSAYPWQVLPFRQRHFYICGPVELLEDTHHFEIGLQWQVEAAQVLNG